MSRQPLLLDAGIRTLVRIGDCLSPGTIAAAVYGGHRAAREHDASVPEARLHVDDKILPLSPGMLASVEIKTGRRTAMEYILSPVIKATGEAGRER